MVFHLEGAVHFLKHQVRRNHIDAQHQSHHVVHD
jgi:hypothetical protein